MLEALSSLIALQALDSAADSAKKRIAEVPTTERALDQAIATAQAAADAAKATLAENAAARRALEKDVATIDSRMAKFEEHKSAVKTNEQFQALNLEIATAQTSKSELEDQIIALLDVADGLEANLKAANAALAEQVKAAEAERKVLHADVQVQNTELARLSQERIAAAAAVPPAMLAKYEQLLKGRKGVAVAEMVAGVCTACHVRLRPNVEQQVRRNDGIVQCDSCQRMLYWVAPPPADTTEAPAPPQ